MKAPIRVGLPPGLRVLYIERYPEVSFMASATWEDDRGVAHRDYPTKRIKQRGYWRLPVHTNPERTLGTFLHFYDNGRIEQHTLRADQPNDEIVLIKPEDD